MSDIEWIKSSERLPPKNQKVLAWLAGFQFHTGVAWRRCGYAFMVRHPQESSSVKDDWSRSFYEDALKVIGADSLEVTHWAELTPPEGIEL